VRWILALNTASRLLVFRRKLKTHLFVDVVTVIVIVVGLVVMVKTMYNVFRSTRPCRHMSAKDISVTVRVYLAVRQAQLQNGISSILLEMCYSSISLKLHQIGIFESGFELLDFQPILFD